MIFRLILLFILLFSRVDVHSQTLRGKVISDDNKVPFAHLTIEGLEIGVSSDDNGYYEINNIPLGENYIIVSSLGKKTKRVLVNINEGVNTLNLNLKESIYNLNQIVVTATRTPKRKNDSPVIVNIIDSKKMKNTSSCNLAEALVFQNGLRVQSDCQTCNYTQLRINGLSGGYSQILINGRSSFSPLTGLYGMEQIPVNMIDRIEVVKGGGSAIYGSSAVGGVVNVITKIPERNSYDVGFEYNMINNFAHDKIISANYTVLSESKHLGGTFFINTRGRSWYDHNNDNFSELPLIDGRSFGVNLFVLPSKRDKLELSLGFLDEYRYGGEMVYQPPHLSLQAEEREHDVFMANVDYTIFFNNNKSSFIGYLAGQRTAREHYTGIRPEIGTINDFEHLDLPPYGSSLSISNQVGFQLNHKISGVLGNTLITLGAEYIYDDIFDQILAYDYLVDQNISNISSFFQSDWIINDKLTLLSGLRFDKHSFLNDMVLSPRNTLMYKISKEIQFRCSYSTGFRAPQAFDTDLHVAFAGGGISRFILSDNLTEESSHSISSSINYDTSGDYYMYGFTFEGFYTILDDAFIQEFIGQDEFGDIFLKKNGGSANVKGFNLEIRCNVNNLFQFESGFTLQNSSYESAINYSVSLPSKKEFLRSPNRYGYFTLFYNPSSNLNLTSNIIYTGPMHLVHFAGSPEQDKDEFITSSDFISLGLKASYVIKREKTGPDFELSCGVKNLFNDFQQDLDTSKNRDSNYIYGPNLPRTIYFGLSFVSL